MSGQAEIYSESQLDLFISNFTLSGKPGNENSIHEYRIAAKRILTILRIIEKIHPENKLKDHKGYEAIRKAFKLGGTLRENAVNIALLGQAEKKLKYQFRAVRNFILKKIKKAGRDHKTFIKKFPYSSFTDLQKKIPMYFRIISQEEMNAASDQIMESCISEIRDLADRGILNKNLHEARKVIKNIKYIFELRGLKEGDPGIYNLTLLSITHLEDNIGRWHDWQVFREILGTFLSQKKNNSGIRSLQFSALFSLTDKTLLSIQKEVCVLIEQKFLLRPQTGNA